MKITLLIFVSVFIVALSSCDYKGQLKRGYTSVSLPESEKMFELEAKLRVRKIDHYTYTDQLDGNNYIAYPTTHKDEVTILISELYGRLHPFKNTKSLCSSTKEGQEYAVSALKNKNITFTTGNENESFCVYWPAEEDKKVEEAYPTYKQIKEACEKDPRCKEKI